VILFFLCSSAHAACTGSGLVWTCTAGSTITNVQSAVNNAADGATITFEGGSYSWASGLSFSAAKGITLVCATPLACTVNAAVLWQWANWGTTAKLYRISGFDFTNPGSYFLWLYATGNSTATLTNLRFDHNRLTLSSSGSDIITLGEITGMNTTLYGVIDHNIFRTTSGHSRWIVSYVQTATSWPVNAIGTANNLFIEDNTFNDQCLLNAGNAAIDTDGGRFTWVIRHNTFTNARIEHHGYYWSFPGPANSEVYGNTLTMTCGPDTLDGSYAIKHQGSGEWIVFNNTVNSTGGKGAAHILQNYRSFYDSSNECDGSRPEDGNRSPVSTHHGYPCNRQPGRNAAGVLKPQYYWNNRWGDGSAISMNLSCADQGIPNYCSTHVQANRDYYQGGAAVQNSPTSPFNGSSNMGFGTLANRPLTCSSGFTDPADAGHGGVGYFATDVGPQGTLYQCSAPNAWTVYYTPFTYPHPLVTGTPPPPPAGSACDLNGDSATNVSDVQMCVNQAIGVAACGSADINKDGSCNVVDVQRDVNAALGGICVSQ
jgi:hypothetical protein